jgi:phosphoribosylformylglycinamidine synthase
MEKLLLEACLEVTRKDGLVVGIQDMGAAGLTCSTCETASRGGTGIEIDLDKVPKRETGMTPYEIMLSESQERMLLIAQKGREKEVEAIFKKWDLHGVKIGHVTEDGMMRVTVGRKVVAEIAARKLTDEAPVCHRKVRPMKTPALKLPPEPKDYHKVLVELLRSPTVASKNWVYRQYDHMVQDRTVIGPGSDAAVIRLHETGKFIAFTTDCNATYCRLDPFEGGKTAVAEAARNLVCSGARPLAVTDNLNFGNPMKPEVFWQFRRCVEGISAACQAFGTPVTGGNVSFYNESRHRGVGIDPTPVIGMLGLIDEAKHITTQWFKGAGDVVVLLGKPGRDLGGSEYLKCIHRLKAGRPPRMDLHKAKQVHDYCLEIIRQGWVKSAHDCSEGGLAVALAECCMSNGDAMVGAEIDLRKFAGRLDAVLFGETQSRIVVSCAPEHAGRIAGTVLGRTGGARLKIKTSRGELAWDIAKMRDVWWNAIGREVGD